MMNLIDSIDRYLLSREDRKRKSHYASDITACRRQLYWKWTGEEKTNPPDAGAFWKMKMGEEAEQIIYDWAEWAVEQGEIQSYDTQVHYRVQPEGFAHPIGMRFDLVIDGSVGVEIKTSFGQGIKAIQKTGSPKNEHLYQVAAYIKLTPVKNFKMIYFGRDNSYRTEFDITDHERGLLVKGQLIELDINDVLARLIDVELALQLGRLPDRDFQVAIKNGEIRDKFQADGDIYKSDWQCRYCDWKDKCWADEVRKYNTGDNRESFDKYADIKKELKELRDYDSNVKIDMHNPGD
jgi:hypothetical protein